MTEILESKVNDAFKNRINKRVKNRIEKTEEEIRGLLFDPKTVATVIIELKDKLKENADTYANRQANKYMAIYKVLTQQDVSEIELESGKYLTEEEKKTVLKNLSKNVNADFLKDIMSVEFWKNYINAKINALVSLANNITDFMQKNPSQPLTVMFANGDYTDLVNFITDGEKPNGYTDEEIIANIKSHYDGGILSFYDEIYTAFSFYYLKQIKKYGKETTDDMLYLVLNFSDLKEEKETEIAETIDRLNDIKFAETLALYIIKENKDRILDEYIEGLKEEYENAIEEEISTGKKKQTTKDASEIIPRYFYSDEMLISQSDYINSLVTNGFVYDENIFNTSEKTLDSLRAEDREILDFLILTLYAGGVRRFTDRQIAIALYKKGDSYADVGQEELKKINDSIERLRTTEIRQGIESKKDIGKAKLKIVGRPFLISVYPSDVEHSGKTTVYDFTGTQGFYEYAQITNKVSRYSNALITADILGLQHDFKNDTLKRLLTRRVMGLKFSRQQGVDIREIYEVLEIKDPRKYTTARKKASKILDELTKHYNFKYSFKKKGKTTTLLVIESFNDRPLEKKSNYTPF